jgi:flagellar biosynthesis/type III secretory pathway protein FliH
MSSWSDAPSRSRVLRDVAAVTADLSSVRSRAGRDLVVDPQLVADATEDGYRRGYDAGFQAGIEDAAHAIESRERARGEQLASAVRQLAAAADQLAARRGVEIPNLELEILRTAFLLSEDLVGAELAHCESRGGLALSRALALAPATGPVTARLHPDDLASLDGTVGAAAGRNVTLVEDASIAPGDCVVDVDDCRILARIDEARDRMRAILWGDGS